MNKYEPLTTWLDEQRDDPVELSFADLEALVGTLPPSATRTRSWWANNARNSQGGAWVSAGWLATPDFARQSVTFERGEPASRAGAERAKILDGKLALEDFVRRAGWKSLLAAVASQTVFLHPDTVEQAGKEPMFPIIRGPLRGEIIAVENGRRVMMDDNTSPTKAFLWAADREKGPDVQFNHVWQRSDDPQCYTALWNLCCTPAFLAKTCDTHPAITAALRYRAERLYGYRPDGEPPARQPDGYDDLVWAPFPPPVADLEGLFRARLRSSPSSRHANAAREIGWRFSAGPDKNLEVRVIAAGA